LDAKLDVLLQAEGIDAAAMFTACQNITAIDPNCLMCLNFLASQSDYQAFITMMLEYKDVMQWQVKDDKEGEDEKKES
jgi:hypothetical protein